MGEERGVTPSQARDNQLKKISSLYTGGDILNNECGDYIVRSMLEQYDQMLDSYDIKEKKVAIDIGMKFLDKYMATKTESKVEQTGDQRVLLAHWNPSDVEELSQ